MRQATVQASLVIRAVSREPMLFAHVSAIVGQEDTSSKELDMWPC